MTTPDGSYLCHATRSKSISSLPHHDQHHQQQRSSHRLTPSTSCASSSTGQGTLSRSSSIRSKPTSPSRLPATDSVSYFPPFEVMGSSCGDEGNHIAESSASARERERGRRGHAKGRSLGSIAGIMSASLSWSLTSLSTSVSVSPPRNDDHHSGRHTRESSNADCDAVEALTKRCTPGKRRVLEPLPLSNELNLCEVKSDDVDAFTESTHKRRMKSVVEVDKLVLGMSNAARWRKLDQEEDEAGVVEGLVDDTPCRPSTTTRRQRPTLQVPIPSFPNWRFPLPSPPVTCLSPDIPLEAFHRAIDNPAAAASASIGSSLRNSPSTNTTHLTARTSLNGTARRSEVPCAELDGSESIETELDGIDDDLLPSPTATSCSEPFTPPKSSPYQIDIKHASPSDAQLKHEYINPKLELTRSSSQLSCETIRPMSVSAGIYEYEEVTPKAKKCWKGFSSEGDPAVIVA